MPSGLKQTFCVQTFRSKGKGLEAEPAQPAKDEGHALRLAERLATGRAGAVAMRLNGDPERGEFDDPVVLGCFGRVPPVFMDPPY